jgi:drug/metabolite transporter (DMT)-like permease
VFGAALTFGFGDGAFSRWPWLWGVGLVLAGAVNWVGGSRLNRTPLNPFRTRILDRLTYRASNKFLSLPMELWALPTLVLGVVLIARGLM